MSHIVARPTAELNISVVTPARDSLEAVTRQDLLGRLKARDVVVLDVRPEDEFAAGHLPGALIVPLASLNRAMLALPRDKEIVAYCRRPYCVLSFDAVDALRGSGFQARRLEDGFPEWKAAGLTVEVA